MTGVICLAAIALLMAACATDPQEEFASGMTAYSKGDYDTAIKKWQPLAEQGNPGAVLLLGSMYVAGQGVPKDFVQAYFWFTVASEQNDPTAKQNALNDRALVARQMTPAQIEEAEKLATEWKPKRSGENE